ncbi:MAG: hypothetical protein AAB407_02160 [Patescibacteria group bacterium]
MENKSERITKRIAKNKELLLEHLKKTPILQFACEKSGISRATIYRWRTEDKVFSDAMDIALHEGKLLVNDIAESQVMAAIRERNFSAATFWLRHHHPDYATRVELAGRIMHERRDLTDEEKSLIEKALRLALPPEELPTDNKQNKPNHE